MINRMSKRVARYLSKTGVDDASIKGLRLLPLFRVLSMAREKGQRDARPGDGNV
jgi:hypothetical protein